MQSKDADNEKARQLYESPKSTSLELQNQDFDMYGFICKNNNKCSSEKKQDILKWEEILRKNCQICLSEDNLKICQVVKDGKNETGIHTEIDHYDNLFGHILESTNSVRNQIEFNNIFSKPKNTIEQLIFKGIPVNMKGRVWKHMLRKKGFESLKINEYTDLKNKKSGFEYQIHVDIQRTFRNHKLFHESYSKGQCNLFKVLVAYSNFNPSVGYCQGMASFVGLLLMYFPEYDCFNVLINILSKLNRLFDHDLSLLSPLLILQQEILLLVIPEVSFILKNENVDLKLFMYSWYLTLFSRFDIKLTLRIWDLFIFFGRAVLPAICSGILSFYFKKMSRLQGEILVKFLASIDVNVLNENEVEEIMKKIKYIMNDIDLMFIEKRLFQ